MSEAEIQRVIQLAVSRAGYKLFRNNVGNGLMIHHGSSMLKQAIINECIALAEKMGAKCYRVQFGLCVGSSDTVGWSPDGRFTAIEIKSERGRLTEEQSNFGEQVTKAGGIFVVGRSPEQVLEELKRYEK